MNIQNQIRELSGLALILNCCVINDSEPFLRECGLFAIKSVCFQNRENQELLRQLKPLSAVQHSFLEKAGLSAQLNSSGGVKLLKNK
jgi:ataxin-10